MIPNFALSDDHITVICSSIHILISYPIEGVSKSKERETINLAKSLSRKVKSKVPGLTLEDLRIMYISLFNIKNIVDETGSFPKGINAKNGSEEYLSILNNLLIMINIVFESNGIDIS